MYLFPKSSLLNLSNIYPHNDIGFGRSFSRHNTEERHQHSSSLIGKTGEGIEEIISNIEKRHAQEVENMDRNTLIYDNIAIERYNHGKPLSPNIEIDPLEISHTMPQAWMKNNNWYYNYDGAMEEARFCGKRMLTEEEWNKFLSYLPGDVTEKNNFIGGGVIAGMFVPSSHEVWCAGSYNYWWCLSQPDTLIAPVVYLGSGNPTGKTLAFSHNHAFSLRLCKEQILKN